MAGFIIPYYFTTITVLLLNVVPVTTWASCRRCQRRGGDGRPGMSLQGYALRPAAGSSARCLFASALFLIAPGVVNDLVGLLLLREFWCIRRSSAR